MDYSVWTPGVIGKFLQSHEGQGLVVRVIRSAGNVVYVRFEKKTEGALPTATVTRRWPLHGEAPMHRPFEEADRIAEELKEQKVLGLGREDIEP